MVIADQQKHQCQLGMHPALAEKAGAEPQQPAAENQCGNHCRAHDAAIQLAFHDAESLFADRIFALCVVNKQAWQVKQASKPTDDADDVEGF